MWHQSNIYIVFILFLIKLRINCSLKGLDYYSVILLFISVVWKPFVLPWFQSLMPIINTPLSLFNHRFSFFCYLFYSLSTVCFTLSDFDDRSYYLHSNCAVVHFVLSTHSSKIMFALLKIIVWCVCRVFSILSHNVFIIVSSMWCGFVLSSLRQCWHQVSGSDPAPLIGRLSVESHQTGIKRFVLAFNEIYTQIHPSWQGTS